MKTELIFKSTPFKSKTGQEIKVKQEHNKRIIIFRNKDQLEFAKKSTDFLEDFFDLYGSSRIDRTRIIFGGTEFKVSSFFDTSVLEYLSNYSYTEKKEIIDSLIKLSGKYSEIELANKFSVFLINLKKLSKSFAKDRLFKSIMPTIKSLYSNTIPREPHVIKFNNTCKETYSGFIRAIRSGTLTTEKVVVNGKERRMFFKSLAGSTETDILTKRENKSLRSKEIDLKEGYLELAIDPTTLEIYAIKTKDGIHFGTPAEKLTGYWLSKNKEKQMKELLRTELERYLNMVYAKKEKGKITIPGIRRMKETHRRMASKAK